ncbi:MAG: hypothetical protein HZA49_09540 [Planctomycetes bacterium]|nr:hypothetical protein [Planctomycetota bacterium]
MKKSVWLSALVTAGIITSLACNSSPQEPVKAAAPTPPTEQVKVDSSGRMGSTMNGEQSKPAAKAKPAVDENAIKASELMRAGVEAIQSGDYPKSLQTYQEVLKLIKEDNPEIGTVYYNLACTYALMSLKGGPASGGKETTLALEYLAKAIKAGYDNREFIEADPDLVFLKDMPEFKAVLDLIPPITALANTPEDDAAQKEAIELIEKVHGLKFKEMPKYQTLTPEMFARSYGGQSDSIQGFYRWADKTLYLKQGLDPVRFKGTRIHETFHALQDQLFGMGELQKTIKTTDGNYALLALIEGDATLTFIECMPESMAKMMIASATPWRMMGGEPKYDRSQRGEAAARQGAFGYSIAARFVQAIKEAKGWAGVNAMYTNIPKSTEQVLHPAKYLAQEQPVEVALPEVAASLGAGWEASKPDTAGEFGLLLGLLTNEKSGPLAEEAALGWAGDKIILVGNKGAQKGFAIHKSAWDTAKDAREFFDASVLAMESNGQVQKDGNIATSVNDTGETDYLALNGLNVVMVNNLPPELKDKVIQLVK